MAVKSAEGGTFAALSLNCRSSLLKSGLSFSCHW